MSKEKNKKQPIPKLGFEFNGWAVFNWGISYDIVFRTRADAKKWIIRNQPKGYDTWEKCKGHMHIAKVKCTVVRNF